MKMRYNVYIEQQMRRSGWGLRIFARRIAKLTGAPLVHTYHTLYEDYVPYVIPSKRVGKYAVGKLSRMRLKKASKIIRINL